MLIQRWHSSKSNLRQHRIRLPFAILLVLFSIGDLLGSPREIKIRANKITEGQAGFGGDLDIQDAFGQSVAGIGDLDGDGINDAAVGAYFDDDGGLDRGAVYILFLNSKGAVKSEQKISDTAGGFTGGLENADRFGSSVISIGDLNGDGVSDLAVGASGTDIGKGAVWILFMRADGTVMAQQEISSTAGGFTGILDNSDSFGQGVASLGDLDGDGVVDLAVGTPLDDDGGGGGEFANRGAVWILFLNPSGTVKAEQKISATEGGFTGLLEKFDNFGYSVAQAGDINGDGVIDLAVGAWADSDAMGAVWIVFLKLDGTVQGQQKITSKQGGFTGRLDPGDFFGVGVTSIGDANGDGVPDIGVGAFNDDDGGDGKGAVWLLFLKPDGTVRSFKKISALTTGGRLPLESGDFFGSSLSLLGDLNNDGHLEMMVGAILDSDAARWAGAAWIISFGVRANQAHP